MSQARTHAGQSGSLLGKSRGAMASAIAVVASLAIGPFATAQYLTVTGIDKTRYTTGSAIFGRNALVTVGGYQFTPYYDNDGFVKVARRRKLAGGGWSGWTYRTTKFTSFDLNDGHNATQIGIDGDGYLHITWGVHNNTMQYTRSTASVLNDDPIELIGDTVGNDVKTGVLGNELALHDKAVTYPEFFSVPGGDLLMTYRTGISGIGEYQLARWSTAARKWSSVHVATTNDSNTTSGPQPWIDNQYLSTKGPPDSNAYIHGLVWDGNGRLYTSWVWRRDGWTYQSNHNLMCAYSDNNGADWKLMDGTPLNRDGWHDIDEVNATPVMVIPEKHSLINQGDMTVDRENRPMIASWWAPNAASGDNLRQFMLAWWDGKAWRTSQVSSRVGPEANNALIDGKLMGGVNSMVRPSVLVDKAGRVIVLYRDGQRNGRGLTAAYTESPDREVWTTINLTDDGSSSGEPTYDKGRWASDGVIAVISTSPKTGQLSVYEFDWNRYISERSRP